MSFMVNSSYVNQMHTNDKLTNEPWPDDATLYQPYEAEQILLPENASCLAVKAYLQMCQLPFEERMCPNAEFMSPGGRMTKLPLLRAGAFFLAEFEPIVNFVEHKGAGLGQWMDEDRKADMRTFVSLVENIFTMAEIFVSFKDDVTYAEVTSKRNGVVYPWPLNILQNYSKRRNALRLLKVYQWNRMTMSEVVEKVDKCCSTLAHKLEESGTTFFFSDQPCELDAIAFGHIYSILTTRLPNLDLARAVQKYTRLVDFCHFIDGKYFQKNLPL